MSIKNKIITRLKELRGEGITPTAIARETGVPQSTLSRILAGRTSMSVDTADKLLPVIFDTARIHALQHKKING
jgi:plasmid maintenance system antidote protein VapI